MPFALPDQGSRIGKWSSGSQCRVPNTQVGQSTREGLPLSLGAFGGSPR